MKKVYFIILLLLIIGLGLYFRLLCIDMGALWYDEVGSYSVAAQGFPLGIIKKLAAHDVHAPLYFIILHFWIKFFGPSEVPLRLLSVIFGVLCIPAVYFTGKRFFSTGTALIAAALMAVNSIQICYSQEIRFYSLASFLSIISIYFLLKIIKNPSAKAYLWFSTVNLAMLYTSNFAPVFVFSEVLVIYGFLFASKNLAEIKRFSIYQIACLVLYVPNLLLLLNQIGHTSAEFINIEILKTLTLKLTSLVVPYPAESFAAIALIHIFPLITFVIALAKGVKENRNVILLGSLAILFLFLNGLLAMHGKMPLFVRYMIFISPMLIIIWAYGISAFKSKVFSGSLLFFSLGIFLYFLFMLQLGPMHHKRTDVCEQSAKILKQYNLDKGDYVIPIISAGGGSYFLKEYYADFFGLNLNVAQFDLTRAIPEAKCPENIPSGSRVAVFYSPKMLKIALSTRGLAFTLKMSKFTDDFIKTCKKQLKPLHFVQDKDLKMYIFEKP